MDYRMPIKNGIEATIEILKMTDHSRIIFATVDEDTKEKALKLGAFSVVNTPFNFEQLLTSIKNALKIK